MSHSTARTLALLMGLLVILGRGASSPNDLAAAGGLALATYAVSVLGMPMVQRLMQPSESSTPISPNEE